MATRAQQFEIFASGALYNGAPLSTGYAQFFAAGTNDAKNAYDDKDKGTSCTKKALDAQGRAEVYGDGVYKIKLYEGDPDAGGTLRATIDDYKCTAVVGGTTIITDDYSADRDDEVILVNTTSKSITVSLDDVNNFDNPVTIKKIHASNTVTIDPNGAQTVDGSSTMTLSDNNETVVLYPDTNADVWRRGDSYAALTSTSLELNLLDGSAYLFQYGMFNRGIFTYNGGSTAYTVKVKPGWYLCAGKKCWWDEELTTSAIGTPSADTWYYLYLDYSAITDGTEITNTELIWSDTAPSYNMTHRGYYNGNDRCIFAVLTNSGPTNIYEFFHDGGDYCVFADTILNYGPSDLDTTWVDVTLSAPGFSTKASITAIQGYGDGNATMSWRTNGQTGTTGHPLVYAAAGITDPANSTIAWTDSSQQIEVKLSGTNTNTAEVFTDGWYFPAGI
jgi:hypothetical protein